jgi:DNA-binding transcriptional regulator YdaS (Cro superfamily)
MTPKQFTAALAQLELSQVGAAKLLGCDERSARRYAAGDREIPAAVAKLLRLALAGKVTVEEIETA